VAPPLAPPAARLAVRIAVARDEAFSFYYEDNFDILRNLGAELSFFSPLRDASLPADADALYLGGGYPELHLDGIAGNGSMRDSIRAASNDGMPIYAECGGYLYLLAGIEDSAGNLKPCVGLAPGVARAGKRLAALGYREGKTLGTSPAGRKGASLRGHVFHYFRVEGGDAGPSITLARPGKGAGDASAEGFLGENLFASFLHVHFAANPAVAKSLVAAARRHAEKRKRVYAR
jgi:cobyrinic acid a,c-diamide synthase